MRAVCSARKEGRHDMTYRQWLNVVKWVDAQSHYIHAREEMEETAHWLERGGKETYKCFIEDMDWFDSAYWPKFVRRAYEYAKEQINGNNDD